MLIIWLEKEILSFDNSKLSCRLLSVMLAGYDRMSIWGFKGRLSGDFLHLRQKKSKNPITPFP